MLNLLQHYQKYNKVIVNQNNNGKFQLARPNNWPPTDPYVLQYPCPANTNPTSPTQLCARYAADNPKYRQYTNCTQVSPGQIGTPNGPTAKPQQSAKQQHSNKQWIGVM